MNYCDFLFNIKEEWHNNIALIDSGRGQSFTYSELQNSVISLSEKFTEYGIKEGEKVLLHLVNSTEVVISHLAIQYLGGVSCLLDPLIPQRALGYYIEDTNSKIIITTLKKDSFKNYDYALTQIIHSTEILKNINLSKRTEYSPYGYSENELSVIFYTSGTTNKPKGVMLSPQNYFNHVKVFNNGCYKYESEDKLLCFVPFSHGYGSKSLFLPCLKAGATFVIMRSFHPYKVVEAIEKYGITHLFGVPSHFQQLLKKDDFVETLKKLKASFTAAALLKTETAKEWKTKIGTFLDEGYGLIETSTGVAFRKNRLPIKLGDIGTYPKDLVKIEVVDNDFKFLPIMEKGEIVIKSKSVMLGYLNKSEETNRVIKDGWFRTGDMGYKTEDNQIVLTGRIKDVINIAGIKVAPFEIESEINENVNVNESAVIGIEDDTYGEIVIGFVKLNNGTEISERELIKYLQSRLMNFQIPKRIYFVDDFPRNNMGKVDKKKLKMDVILN